MDKTKGSRNRLSELTRPECEFFRQHCNFTPDELAVFDMRARDKSVVQISMDLNMSERTVKRKISSIKKKMLKVV